MGFIFFHKIAVLLGTGEVLSDASSPCFSTRVISWSGCLLSIYILCNPEWISLLRTCTLSFLRLRHPLGRHSAGLLVTRLKKHFFGLFCTWLLLSFIWWPRLLVAEEGVNKLISVPLSSKQLVVSDIPILFCPPYPTYSSLYSRLERPDLLSHCT